jgi:Mce-associated membrane protein
VTAARATGVLSTVLLVLAAVLGAEAWYLWGVSGPAVSAQRPVVTGDIAARAAVEAAGEDLSQIFTNSWRNYDGHIAHATALMTDGFATRYRAGAGPVRESVVSSRTRTTTRVAAAGVVRAAPDQVEALVFLDQATTTRGGPPSYADRRALVTMVHTDRGWLVGNVQTQ